MQQVRKGTDPYEAERERDEATQEAKRAAETKRKDEQRLAFGVIADRFVEKYAKVEQPKTWRDTESIVPRDLKPHFGDTPLPRFTDTDIIELLDKVHERGDSAAIKAYKALRTLFGWAKTKRLISTSNGATVGALPPPPPGFQMAPPPKGFELMR